MCDQYIFDICDQYIFDICDQYIFDIYFYNDIIYIYVSNIEIYKKVYVSIIR
jgi:hypothetical protein